MKLPRRDFLHLAAGAAALPAVSRIALKTSALKMLSALKTLVIGVAGFPSREMDGPPRRMSTTRAVRCAALPAGCTIRSGATVATMPMIILLALLVAVLLPRPAGAQTTETFRDSLGRITGTASRDANGT